MTKTNVLNRLVNTALIALLIVALVGCLQATATANNSADDSKPDQPLFPTKDVSGGVEITGYTGSATNLELPSKIDGKDVVSIADGAFKGKTFATVSLSTATPPTIGAAAFDALIANLYVPAGAVTAYDIAPWNTTFSTIYAVLDSSVLTLTDVTGGVEISAYTGSEPNVVIPDAIDGKAVVSIASNTFNSKNLTSVIVADSVTTIAEWVFYVNSLTTITLGSGLTSIGTEAFSNNGNSGNTILNVTITAKTPPSLIDTTFQPVIDNLYVPADSVDAYKASDWDKDFTNITAISP